VLLVIGVARVKRRVSNHLQLTFYISDKSHQTTNANGCNRPEAEKAKDFHRTLSNAGMKSLFQDQRCSQGVSTRSSSLKSRK
jgi:hypothetical protein